MNESEIQKLFKPDERYALVLGNDDYSEIRQKEHFSGVQNLEEVKEDLVNVKNGLKRFGFGEFDIRV